jgi:hypothetical protein
VTQLADPRDRCAVHRARPAARNATVPVGVRPDEWTVADSLTLAPTQALVGLTDTLVVEGCLACGAAVAALAGSAHKAQAAVATAVTDTSRTKPAPTR